MAKNADTVPIEVFILTKDHDIKGTVHVSKYTNTNRELTDLLNDKDKRFIAVTNAEIMSKNSSAAPRKYDFLEVHVDAILLVHLALQKTISSARSTSPERLNATQDSVLTNFLLLSDSSTRRIF